MKKLSPDSHIRVLSPSDSIARLGGFEANLSAKETLENLGFRVSFSEHYLESDMLDSSSIESRVADLHAAFLDDSVDAILATIGGFNSNELLNEANPNFDINMGPSYSSFKMKEGQDYQSKAWLNAMTKSAYDLVPSQEWSSDPWYDPTQPRHFMPTEWKIYNAGKASGTIIGGNLSTFGLLRGTPYTPQVNDYVLFLEEAEEDDYHDFDRNLAAILQAYPNPKAVLIGRFPKECQMTPEILTYILDKHPLLKTIPVMYDLDFAHTQPLFTITIGAQASIDTDALSIHIEE